MLLRVLFCLFAVNYDLSFVWKPLLLSPLQTYPPSLEFLGRLYSSVFTPHASYFRPFMESKLKSSQRQAITRQIDHYKLMASSQFKYCYF